LLTLCRESDTGRYALTASLDAMVEGGFSYDPVSPVPGPDQQLIAQESERALRDYIENLTQNEKEFLKHTDFAELYGIEGEQIIKMGKQLRYKDPQYALKKIRKTMQSDLKTWYE